MVCTAFLAAGLLPLDGTTSPIRFTGDLIAFAGLLALGRFMLVLSAMDTGSSFEGMGASREVTFAVFAEPALILCFTVLVVATGDLRLQGMLGQPLTHTWLATAPSLVLGAASLFIVSLAETNRVPIDDPLTHLELTMVHEVMVLDHSGPDLALILYASALKMTLFGSLVVRVLVAGAIVAPPMALGLLLVGLVGYAMAVGVVESVMARLRMNHVPQLLVAASATAGFGLILLLR
jgi:formate hydrogenlyase subunit 4